MLAKPPAWISRPAETADGTSVRTRGSLQGLVFSFSARVQMELLVERIGSSSVVMYYDKGDPDQGTTGQYQFTKTRSGTRGVPLTDK